MECIPIELFTEKSACKDFTCTFCLGVMLDPVSSNCSHVFGRICFEEWLKIQPKCPLCRANASVSSFSSHKQLASQIQNFHVICPNFSDCTWIGLACNFFGHVNKECEFQEVECQTKDCTGNLQRRFLPRHSEKCRKKPIDCRFCKSTFLREALKSHEEVCNERLIKCPLGCGENVKHVQANRHLALECLEFYDDCPFKNFGCEFSGKREEIIKHLRNRQSSEIHMNKSISGFFSHLKTEKSNIDLIFRDIEDLKSAILNERNARSFLRQKDYLKDGESKFSVYFNSVDQLMNAISKKMKSFSENLGKSLEQVFLLLANNLNELENEKKIFSKTSKEKFQNFKLAFTDKEDLFNSICELKLPKFETFDKKSSGSAISIVNSQEVRHIGNGNLALLDKPLFPYVHYKFHLFDNYGGPNAIGVCVKELAWANGFLVIKGREKGCHMFFTEDLREEAERSKLIGKKKPEKEICV